MWNDCKGAKMYSTQQRATSERASERRDAPATFRERSNEKSVLIARCTKRAGPAQFLIHPRGPYSRGGTPRVAVLHTKSSLEGAAICSGRFHRRRKCVRFRLALIRQMCQFVGRGRPADYVPAPPPPSTVEIAPTFA